MDMRTPQHPPESGPTHGDLSTPAITAWFEHAIARGFLEAVEAPSRESVACALFGVLQELERFCASVAEIQGERFETPSERISQAYEALQAPVGAGRVDPVRAVHKAILAVHTAAGMPAPATDSDQARGVAEALDPRQLNALLEHLERRVSRPLCRAGRLVRWGMRLARLPGRAGRVLWAWIATRTQRHQDRAEAEMRMIAAKLGLALETTAPAGGVAHIRQEQLRVSVQQIVVAILGKNTATGAG